MKVTDDEVRIVKRDIRPGGAQKESAETARYKYRDESQREHHRSCELNARAPQAHDPAQHENGGRNGDQHRCQCEDAAEYRIHSADEHMMSPDNETQSGDR